LPDGPANEEGPPKKRPLLPDGPANEEGPPKKLPCRGGGSPTVDVLEFVVGMHVEGGGRCIRCNLWVVEDRMRKRSKTSQTWLCKTCNSRGTSLHRLYGTWPPQRFQLLGKEQREEFWKKIAKERGRKGMVGLVTETIKVSKIDKFGHSTTGKYLPLSVYQAQGYDAAVIERNCQDFKFDPVVGTVYRIAGIFIHPLSGRKKEHA
jgi:hypothetical protein